MCLALETVKTIRLANGLDIEVRESGDPQGVPVFLLHGVTDSLRCWKPFTDVLPRTIRAIAVSQRGHGDSSRPKGDYSSSAFAGDLAALMDAMGIARAHVVGHSMSSWIVQRFARDYPQRVAGAVIIGGFVTLAGNPAIPELVEALEGMDETVDPGFARAFQQDTVVKPLPPAYLDMVVSESLKVPTRIWRAIFEAMMSETPDMSSISSRALLLRGEQDAFFSERDQSALKRVFPNHREVRYPDLAHAPHWEEPMRPARDIAAFVLSR